MMTPTEQQRLADLLADEATQGLNEAEMHELESLLAAHPEIEAGELALAVAAGELTQPLKLEALPLHLRSRLLADAEQYLVAETNSQNYANSRPDLATTGARTNSPTAPAAEVVAFPLRRGGTRRAGWQQLGWYAAAACLVLALGGWWQVWKASRPTTAPRTPSLDEQRTHLLQRGATLTKVNWSPTQYPGMQNVTGDVVWDNQTQRGFMRFAGLQINDPNAVVYQLWIFDAQQDERYPIDGGVFDITSTGEVIVPITAKIKVVKPMLFAITMEKPGGVVVSKRDRLVLVAKPG
jgi:hypothetical protein